MIAQLLALHSIVPYLVIVVAFVALIKGADIFVEGSASVAKKLGIPSVIIGLTIVAMGTSAPEAAVSITAAIDKSNGIALGNVVGSNIFNLLVVLGVCMLMTTLPTTREIIKRDYPWNIIATVVVIVFIIDAKLTRIEGIALLLMFAAYIIYVVFKTIKNREVSSEDVESLSWTKSIVFLILGIALIVIGGDFVVDSATVIAKSWGVSDMLIGLTIVACGTSLPELVTSIVAAKKGECDMAIGNVIGSNLFNLLFILGMTTTITPIVDINLADGILVDSILLLGFTIMMYLFSIHGTKLQKAKGAVSVVCYATYLAYIILRAFGMAF